MPRGVPLAPCRRCGGPKESGAKGRKLCAKCKAIYEAERPEVARKRASAWYYAHCDELNEASRNKRATDPEWAKRKDEQIRAWADAHPERVRELNRRKNYRSRKVSQYVEDVDPLVVLERDDNECGICGGDVDPFNFHIDHRVPISKGGEHSYANVQVAHPTCNRRKSARMPEEVFG